MGTIIFSATPFQAFLGQFAAVLFFFIMGVFGIGASLIRSKDKALSRIALAATGGFLILVGCGMSVVVYQEMTSGSKIVTVLVEDKNEVVRNCGDGGTCTSYVLETSATPKYYDFTVSKSTFDKVQVRACYNITYYLARTLISESSRTDTYEAAENITRIEVADASTCAQ